MATKQGDRSIAEKVKSLERAQREAHTTHTIVEQINEQVAAVQNRMRRIRHKVAVMSGKGGVGKSLTTVNLALTLAQQGKKVGILDVDLSGPCIPKMLGLHGLQLAIGPDGAQPAVGPLGIKVASMDLMLPKDETPVMWKGMWEDSAVWRGAVEMSVIRELLSDVTWGDLDLLLIDMPPASSDKPPILAQFIPDLAGAIIVTTPSEVAQLIVKKSVLFINQVLGMPVIGLIENMSGALCPHCGGSLPLFGNHTKEHPLEEIGLPLLGRIPFDPRLGACADAGQPFPTEHPYTPAAQAFRLVADTLSNAFSQRSGS
jgi:ATP-binding protein involved in chromosome partitioning